VPAAEIAVHPNQTVKVSSPWGFPLREDVAFTDLNGIAAEPAGRRVGRGLEKLQEPLRKILEPGETVFYFALAQIMPGKPERYLLGVQSHSLALAALVLTNRRLLHLSLRWTGKWNRNVRSARWGDIKQAHIAGFRYGKLHLEYGSGAKEVYWRIRKDGVKKIERILNVLVPKSAGETSPALSMVSLCPQCLAELQPGVYACSGCGLKFKDEKTVLVHALLIPGGAYFYTGLNLWGVAHAFIDFAVFVSAIIWALAAMGRVHMVLRPGVPADTFLSFFVAIVMATLLVVDIWLSIRISRNAIRRFIPEAR
jgi:hypothetical protein